MRKLNINIRWSAIGTVYLHLVLILALLTRSRTIYLMSWNQKLSTNGISLEIVVYAY